MKIYEWNPVVDGEKHTVVLYFGRLSGRAIITIDGTKFDISHAPLYYCRERREIFRLAEKQAILVIPRVGAPDIVVDRVFVGSGKSYV